MNLGIMQPYFFPYLGYFDLINVVDHFVVYDSVQYMKQGWINRNRVLRPTGGWQYISVPIDKGSFHDSYRTPIMDIRIARGEDWRTRIIRQLDHYRKRAPCFWETVKLVEGCLDTKEGSISKLNVRILEKVCELLEIDFTYSFSSKMGLPGTSGLNAQDRVLAICELLGASRYINLPGGRDLYDGYRFREGSIEIDFRDLPTFEYSCQGHEFIPDLSIVDVLMWNEPWKVREHLEAHR